VTRLRDGTQENRGSIISDDRNFSLFQWFQTCLGSHPTSCTLGNGVLPPLWRGERYDGAHSIKQTLNYQKAWSYFSVLAYVLMSCNSNIAKQLHSLAARFKARNDCVYSVFVRCPVYVAPLQTSWSPTQGVMPDVYKNHNSRINQFWMGRSRRA
jgi:hypothetical protein